MALSREYPARPICGVGAVVWRDDAVLLIQRGHPPRRGEWNLPGGAVQVGETLREAAAREVREECGIAIRLGEMIDAVDLVHYDEQGRVQYHYVVIDFAAAYVSGVTRAASDVLDARWVTRDELALFAVPDLTRQVIAKSRAQTNPNGSL